VKSIGTNAFSNNKITSIIIPGNVEYIGNGAFENNMIRSVTIGNGVKMIGAAAFRDNKIISIRIPASVTEIDYFAFEDNDNIISVCYEGARPSRDKTTSDFGLPSSVIFKNCDRSGSDL